MKNIRIKVNGCRDSLFDYPCKDANNVVLKDKIVSIISRESIVLPTWLEQDGAYIQINPPKEQYSSTQIGIVEPLFSKNESEEGYYEILDYYVQTLQDLVREMKKIEGFKHLIILLPPHSDEYSTSFSYMAYYAVYGLIKGLGRMYAPYGLFVNGIILNADNHTVHLKEKLILLCSDNSCNIIGQVLRL